MSTKPDDLVSELQSLALDAERLVPAVAVSVEAGGGEAPGGAPEAVVDREHFDRLTSAVAQLRHAAERLEMLAAGAADQHGMHRRDPMRRTRTARQWVAREHGLSHRVASQLVRSDEARRRFPELDRAVRANEVTVEQIDAIASVVPSHFVGDDLAAAVAAMNEVMGQFLDAAAAGSVDDLRKLCTSARSLLDPDGEGPDGEKGAQAPSEVRLVELFNGRWSLSGDLSADDGALLYSILDAQLAAEARARAADAEAGAAAGAGSAAGAAANDRDDVRRVLGGPPSFAQSMAAALLRLTLDGAGATAPGRAGIYLHIDLDDLEVRGVEPSDLVNGYGPRACTESNLDISEATLWALFADANVTPVFTRSGKPLSYGRTRRSASSIQRRVLAHRDGGCRSPGCTSRSNWTDAHHLVAWEHGGPTDLDNLVLKCPFDHHSDHGDGIERTELPPPTPLFRERLVQRFRTQREEAAAGGESPVEASEQRRSA